MIKQVALMAGFSITLLLTACSGTSSNQANVMSSSSSTSTMDMMNNSAMSMDANSSMMDQTTSMSDSSVSDVAAPFTNPADDARD